jgi:hypothetical protein
MGAIGKMRARRGETELRSGVVDDMMARDPALFARFAGDHRFARLLWEMEEALRLLQDPEVSDETINVAVKSFGRAVTPWLQERAAIHAELAELYAWDRRPAPSFRSEPSRPFAAEAPSRPAVGRERAAGRIPVGSRVETMYEAAPPSPRAVGFGAATMAVRNMTTGRIDGRTLSTLIRKLSAEGEKEAMSSDPDLATLDGTLPVRVVEPGDVVGWPGFLTRTFRPAKAADAVRTCRAIAANLNERLTDAKKTAKAAARIARLEEDELPRIEALLDFIAPYRIEIDRIHGAMRARGVEETAAERRRSSREAGVGPASSGRGGTGFPRGVVDFSLFRRRGSERCR